MHPGAAHEADQRIAEIVKKLLAFSRHEKESHSWAEVEDIVDTPLILIRKVLSKDQITLEVSLSPDLPRIRCRSQQLQQVLLNLLTNARYAVNQRYPQYHVNKVIKVLVRPFEKNHVPWIRFSVVDRGNGIPPTIMDRIFDPFFTTKPRQTGTGLGLSVSYGIVKDHDGELWAESREGIETSFHMDLPVNGVPRNGR